MQHSPYLQRAIVLHQQGRHELAEKELRQHLAEAPEHAYALALLAISLSELKRWDEAEAAARAAIGHDPELAFAHYALAAVCIDRNRLEQAAAAIREALRLDPADADYHGVQAAIELTRENWPAALEAAERGLQQDSEHPTCKNLRAMALVKLGRTQDARATLDSTLSRDPEDSYAHANKGWALLQEGRREEALVHFKESLRLEPGNDWARSGLVEGLKAGNPIYAILLKYFLWTQRLSPGARWGIVLGGFIGSRLLRGLARTNPALAPVVMPVVVFYIAFALLTWLAAPLFNLLLFLHPLGKHALANEQKRQATLVGICLAVAAIFLVGALNPDWRSGNLLSAMILGLLAIPVSAVFICPDGWPKKVMAVIAISLALTATGATVILGVVHPPAKSDLQAAGQALSAFFFVGTFLSMWIGNYLSSQRPEQ